MSNEVGIVKCENCGKMCNYTDGDIRGNYITSPADVLDGFDFYSKWIECPHCGERIDL